MKTPMIKWKKTKNLKNPQWKGPVVSFNGNGVGDGLADIAVLHLYVGEAVAKRIITALNQGKTKGVIK
jgi:hypothetical protein